MPNAIATRALSSNPEHVKKRLKRLHDDAAANRHNESSTRSKRRAAGKRIAQKARERADISTHWVKGDPSKGHAERIKHHLSRGRDVGDIAIREGWLVSYVLSVGIRFGLLPEGKAVA